MGMKWKLVDGEMVATTEESFYEKVFFRYLLVEKVANKLDTTKYNYTYILWSCLVSFWIIMAVLIMMPLSPIICVVNCVVNFITWLPKKREVNG